MQRSDFIAKVLPIGLFDNVGGGGALGPEPCHTPNVSSGHMDDRLIDRLDERADDLQAEVLAARQDVLRIRAVLRGLAEARQPHAQAG